MKHRIIISSLAALAMLSLQAGAAPAPFFEAHCYGCHDADEKKGGIVFGGSGANRTVTVTPAANQLGSSTITITVSDGTLTASDTFLLAVTGTAQETWRFANFGTTANTGNAADLADANSDGELNLLEYATVQNPNAASLVALSAIRTSSAVEITYTRSKSALTGGVTFAAEWSDTLATNSWSATGVTHAILTDNGIVQAVKATNSHSGHDFIALPAFESHTECALEPLPSISHSARCFCPRALSRPSLRRTASSGNMTMNTTSPCRSPHHEH